MSHVTLWIVLAVSVAALFGACHDTGRAPDRMPSDAASTAGDTTELQRIYGAIDAHHEQLMARYQQMAGQMDGDLQKMVGYMGDMHGQAARMHRGMMGGRGHGMMGREMHEGGGMRGGMMQRRQTREWDRQMRAMHQQMGRHMRQQGHDEMAALHDQMMRYYDEAAAALPEDEGEAQAAPSAPEGEISGQSVYQQYCATCHGTEGQGLGSAFPPLAASGWVTGEAETPIRIVLHGLEGRIQVQGESYDGLMPPFGGRLSDEEIAALLSYVRTRWGNDAGAVSVEAVRRVRQDNAARTQPWTPEAIR